MSGATRCRTGRGVTASLDGASRSVVFRLDGGIGIGSGHIARCSAISHELVRCGAKSVAVVSNEESASLARSRGFSAVVAGGNPTALEERDAVELAPFMAKGCLAVVVDSYGAGAGFWLGLAKIAGDLGVSLVAVDDGYTYAGGWDAVPRRLPVQTLVAYSFYADASAYSLAYAGSGAELLVGPRYAPLSAGFASWHAPCSAGDRVLVTTGSTNPSMALERMCRACVRAVPEIPLDVVVGPSSSFDVSCLEGAAAGTEVHQGLTNLSLLMARACAAVSAGGSTLYELASVGVPAVAIPIVENQIRNVEGYATSGCGISLGNRWTEGEAASALSSLAGDRVTLARRSMRSREIVDGSGAGRIASVILGMEGRKMRTAPSEQIS